MEVIHKSTLLRCGLDEAFELFTERISEWWPESHRLTKDPKSELFLERTGRFWERARDGREVELGRVLVWEPPHFIALDFYVGSGADQPTALEVTFTGEGAGTRLTVEHRAKPESAEIWERRAAVFERSWETLLDALASR